MQINAVFAILALAGYMDITTSATLDQPAGQSVTFPGARSADPSPVLGKRDAFTCYGSSNTSISDCQKVISNIQADQQQNFTLYANVCAVWNEGTCKIRFCAQPYVMKPVNRTADWLATYITSPLLDSCISVGKMGVMSDHPNINSFAGSYRLWVY
ncbi:hypothetical protein F4779DRAFT_605606 [Xylariaceae sp. FL0662B]|nr:hypothetical protein F4779DRAFT_605606 [Xylariaceae sp. FL0662B]